MGVTGGAAYHFGNAAFRTGAEQPWRRLVRLSKTGHYPVDNCYYVSLSIWDKLVKEIAFAAVGRGAGRCRLRSELEDYAAAVGTAGGGRAVEFAVGDEGQIGVRLRAVGAIEGMQQSIFPAAMGLRRQFEDHAVAGTARNRCTV